MHAGLSTSRALIAFDGLGGKPGATTDMRRKYASKIMRVVQGASSLIEVLGRQAVHALVKGR